MANFCLCGTEISNRAKMCRECRRKLANKRAREKRAALKVLNG